MMRLQTQELTIHIGKQTICRNLNLTLNAGEIWGILGANGSGKTTLLHTLAGLYPNFSGQIWLNNKEKYSLKTLTPKFIAQSIAIVLQHFANSFPQTVWEYCQASRYPHATYFKKNTTQDFEIVQQALQTMNLLSLSNRCITQLSGGEKRRLAIACAMAQTPLIYLLDEPMNHLDVHHQIVAFNYFSQLPNATIMLALHDVNLAQRFCSHMLLLFPDGLVLQGQTKEIITAANLSQLYQHKINPAYNGVYWEADSGI